MGPEVLKRAPLSKAGAAPKSLLMILIRLIRPGVVLALTLFLFASCSGLPQQQSGIVGAGVGAAAGAALGAAAAPSGQRGKGAALFGFGGAIAGYKEGVARGDRDIVSVH